MQQLLDPQISLEEPSHTYVHANHPGLEFTSCTGLIGTFFEPFDGLAIAEKLISTHSKYQGQSPQQLIEQWQEAGRRGSRVHGEIDQYLKNRIPPTEELALIAVQWLDEQNWNGAELLSEAILYSTELKLAGTVDLISLDPTTKTLNLYD